MGDREPNDNLLERRVDGHDSGFARGKRNGRDSHAVCDVVERGLVVLLHRSAQQRVAEIHVWVKGQRLLDGLINVLAVIDQRIISESCWINGGQVHSDDKETRWISVLEPNALIHEILRIDSRGRDKRERVGELLG